MKGKTEHVPRFLFEARFPVASPSFLKPPSRHQPGPDSKNIPMLTPPSEAPSPASLRRVLHSSFLSVGLSSEVSEIGFSNKSSGPEENCDGKR